MNIKNESERVASLYSSREFQDVAKNNYAQGASDMRAEAREAFIKTIEQVIGCEREQTLSMLDVFVELIDKN